MALARSVRQNLCSALARVHPDQLQLAAQALAESYPVKVTSLPTNGLAMMRIRESVNGDAFNLGEIPLSTATIELDLGHGQTVSGGAHIMADDSDLAIWVAIADAALTHDLPGSEALWQLYQDGIDKLQADQDLRQSMLARTKVRFSLLNEDISE